MPTPACGSRLLLSDLARDPRGVWVKDRDKRGDAHHGLARDAWGSGNSVEGGTIPGAVSPGNTTSFGASRSSRLG
jgi:hypothetical protein